MAILLSCKKVSLPVQRGVVEGVVERRWHWYVVFSWGCQPKVEAVVDEDGTVDPGADR